MWYLLKELQHQWLEGGLDSNRHSVKLKSAPGLALTSGLVPRWGFTQRHFFEPSLGRSQALQHESNQQQKVCSIIYLHAWLG
jgi:hypothetical protein